MASEKVTFSKGESATLPTDHVAGRLLVATDTGDTYLDTSDTTRIQITDNRKLNIDGSTPMTGNLNVNNHKLINLAEPTNNSDGCTKHYTDVAFQELESEMSTALANYLPLKGGTMVGAVDMGTYKISNIGSPTADTDVTSKQYVDNANAQNLKLSGVTPMAGDLNMANHAITNLSTPVNPQDGVNKQYVDSSIGSITSFRVDSNDGSGYASLEALQVAHPTGEVGVFYLVVNPSAASPNSFDEYFWTGTAYEKAGGFGNVNTDNLATKADLADYLPLSGGTVTGAINSSVTPTQPTNLTNKEYVDQIAGSMKSGPNIYTFTCSETQGTDLKMQSTDPSIVTVNWKPGDIAIIYFTMPGVMPGDYTFTLGIDSPIPISTVSFAKGSNIEFMDANSWAAVYIQQDSVSAFMVYSMYSQIRLDTSTSGLQFSSDGNPEDYNNLKHKLLEESSKFGPITGSTTNLNYGDSFIVPAIGYDMNGHITSGGQQTFVLPQASPEVTQANTAVNQDLRVLLSNSPNNTTETAGVYKSGSLLFNPSTGILIAPKFDGIIDDGVIT